MKAETPIAENRQELQRLHAPGAILLLSCYEMGHQPMALASSLAALEAHGFHPSALDLSVQSLDPEWVRAARLVAISVPMHTALRLGEQVAREVRRLNPHCHICFYGIYAALNASSLKAAGATSCIGPEADRGLVELARSLSASSADQCATERAHPTGLSINPPQRPLAVVPSRRSLPGLEEYAKLEDQSGTRLAGYVEASRGCLHECRHCPIPPVFGGRFVIVPREAVLADIRQQVRMGATHITFGDPDFLNGPGHSLAIVREMHREFPELTFDITTKVEHILERRGLFPELRELGCVFVVSAVESLSDRVLEILDKGHNRADVEEALRALDGAGIPMRPTWVAFTPWTTLRDYQEILEFIAHNNLVGHVDPVQYTIRLLVPPGSLLLSHAAMQPYLRGFDAETFSYLWEHPDPEMDALQRQIAGLVEEATRAGDDDRATFEQIWDCAFRRPTTDHRPPTAGAEACATERPVPHHSQRPPERKIPRLTEPWFC